MSLFMTLLVRDEEDVVEANIRYHLESGVDHVIVTDNRSADSTPEIVRQFVDDGVATLLHERSDDYAQSIWVSRMAAMACASGAKWVVHSDADEFWMPVGRHSLRRCFAKIRRHEVVVAPRHDFVCLDADERPFWDRMIFRKVHSLNPLGHPLRPKVAHRARAGLVVAQGNHAVAGFRSPRLKEGVVEVLHFPLRSREQYYRKIENGGRAYEQNTDLPESVGATWRRQYRELIETGSLSYVEENVVGMDEVQRLLGLGELVEDRRLKLALDALEKG